MSEDFALFLQYLLSLPQTIAESHISLYEMELNGFLWGTSHFGRAVGPDAVFTTLGQMTPFLKLLETQNAFDSLPCRIELTVEDLRRIHEHAAWSEKILDRKPEKQQALRERHREQYGSLREGATDLTFKDLYRLWYCISDARFERSKDIAGIADEGEREDTQSAFLYSEFPVDLRLLEHRTVLAPFLRSTLDTYLTDFREGRVFWPENVLVWEEQERHVFDALLPLERFGTRFYVSQQTFLGADGEWIEGFKPVETLLVLMQEGRIALAGVRLNEQGTLDLLLNVLQPEPQKKMVMVPPLPPEERRKRELLKVYSEVVKRFDLDSFRKEYADNPVALAVVRRITSPEFLRTVGEGIRERKRWQEQYGKVYAEEMRHLQEKSALAGRDLMVMQEQSERASEDLRHTFEAHKPELARLREYSEQTAKDLARDMEAFAGVAKALQAPFEAIAEIGRQSVQVPNILASGAPAFVPGIRQEPMLTFAASSSRRQLQPDEMIISREYYEQLRDAYERQEAQELPQTAAGNPKTSKKAVGRPPKIQWIQGNICDGNKSPIIPQNQHVPIALCQTILALTDSKDRGSWRVEVDALYEAHEHQEEGTWLGLKKEEREKFKKLLRNHVPRINGFFVDKGYTEWLSKDARSVTRQY